MERPNGVVNLAGGMVDTSIPAHSQTRGNLAAPGQFPPSVTKPEIWHIERGNSAGRRIDIVDAILRINLYVMDLVRLTGRHRPWFV